MSVSLGIVLRFEISRELLVIFWEFVPATQLLIYSCLAGLLWSFLNQQAFMVAINIKRYQHKLIQQLSGGNRRKVAFIAKNTRTHVFITRCNLFLSLSALSPFFSPSLSFSLRLSPSFSLSISLSLCNLSVDHGIWMLMAGVCWTVCVSGVSGSSSDWGAPDSVLGWGR